jgi:hypothetical protein
VTTVLTIAVVGTALVYLAQTATPLRLDIDSTEYLILAARLADGSGYQHGAAFPPGLPALIAGLDLVGAARSWAIVLMNVAFIALGLAALARMLRRDLGWGNNAVLGVVLATLLSWQLMSVTTHPLSEAPFLGMSLMSLAAAAEARRRQRLWPLALAVGLALAAMATRTFGVTLVPALVAGLPTARGRRLATPLVAVVGLAGFIALGPSRYLSEAGDRWGRDPLMRVLWQVRDQLQIAGEFAVNVPITRAPAGAHWIYVVVGVGAVALAAFGAASMARTAPVLVVYVAATAALLLAWPFTMDRLAVPVLPVLVTCVGAGASRLPETARRAGFAWALGFAAVGIVGLLMMTRVSFAGDAFPERNAAHDAGLRATYRVAWGTANATDRRGVMPRTLWALRRFEPRALGDPGPPPKPTTHLWQNGHFVRLTDGPRVRPAKATARQDSP